VILKTNNKNKYPKIKTTSYDLNKTLKENYP